MSHKIGRSDGQKAIILVLQSNPDYFLELEIQPVTSCTPPKKYIPSHLVKSNILFYNFQSQWRNVGLIARAVGEIRFPVLRQLGHRRC